jgi:transposase-like protein
MYLDNKTDRIIELPPANTTRWIARRKIQIVEAIKKGVLDVEEACQKYALTEEELASWQRLADKHGQDGLRITQIKLYR